MQSKEAKCELTERSKDGHIEGARRNRGDKIQAAGQLEQGGPEIVKSVDDVINVLQVFSKDVNKAKFLRGLLAHDEEFFRHCVDDSGAQLGRKTDAAMIVPGR